MRKLENEVLRYVKLLVLFAFLFSANDSSASIEDSIVEMLDRIPVSKLRLKKYIDEAEKAEKTDFKLAAVIAEKSTRLSEELNDKQSFLKSSRILARVKGNLGEADESIKIYQKLIKISKKEQNWKEEARCHLGLGNVYKTLNLPDDVRKEYKKAIYLTDKYDLVELKASVYTAFGILEFMDGNLETSEHYFLEILTMSEADTNVQIKNLNNLGNVRYTLKDYDSALYYYRLNYDLLVDQGSSKSFVQLCGNLGNLYQTMGDFQNANLILHEGYKMANEINWSHGVSFMSGLLENHYFEEKDYEKAHKYLRIHQKLSLDLLNRDFLIEKNAEERKVLEAENEKVVLQSKIDKQFLWLMLSFAAVVLIILTMVIRRLTLNRLRQKKRNERLVNQLQSKQKELDNIIKSLSENARISESLSELAKAAGKTKNIEQIKTDLKELNKSLQHNLNRQSDWNVFLKNFESAFPNFHKTLTSRFSNLTSNEVRICIYVKSGLTQKEIARIKYISISGVKTSVKRIKKKLDIQGKMTLYEFLISSIN